MLSAMKEINKDLRENKGEGQERSPLERWEVLPEEMKFK